MARKIKLLVASNSTMAIIGLGDLIYGHEDLEIVGEESTLEGVIARARETNSDIILICLHFLLENGANLIVEIQKQFPDPKRVMFNTNLTMEQELLLVKEGCRGIFRSDCPGRTIINGLRKVHEGGYSLGWGWDMINALVDFSLNREEGKPPWELHIPLSKKELKVIAQVAAGLTNRKVAY